jgi:hypothetical protein
MSNTIFPDFFIVGAAKAGTTSIAEYLAMHPQIYMSPVKEPHFFATDINLDELRESVKRRLKAQDLESVFQGKTTLHRAYITDKNQYLRLFENAGNAITAGEASPSYLYSSAAASEIFKFNPQAKIIILLREPVSRAWSQYLMDLRLAFTRKNFEDALAEDAAAETSGWGSRSLYRELGLYSSQVERYFRQFPKEQILILLYDEMVSDTPGMLKKIFRFLGVDPEFQPPSDVRKNVASVPRNRFMQKLLAMDVIRVKLRTALGDSGLKSAIKKMLYRAPLQTKPSTQTVHQLKQFFREDIDRLEKLTGIDLSAWK